MTDRPDDRALDDPVVVEQEYAQHERLAVRRTVYREYSIGPSAEDIAIEAVGEAVPQRVLEVGCGTGEVSARLIESGTRSVVAIDSSPTMVGLAQARGVRAHMADAQRMPFPDDYFDCVLAQWVLYHLPDLEAGLAEIVRILRPAGRLVAVTFGGANMQDLWRALNAAPPPPLKFNRENGDALLRKHFSHVERRDAESVVVFPSRDAVREYVASTITHSHLADRLQAVPDGFRARTSQTVFVARAPARAER